MYIFEHGLSISAFKHARLLILSAYVLLAFIKYCHACSIRTQTFCLTDLSKLKLKTAKPYFLYIPWFIEHHSWFLVLVPFLFQSVLNLSNTNPSYNKTQYIVIYSMVPIFEQ